MAAKKKTRKKAASTTRTPSTRTKKVVEGEGYTEPDRRQLSEAQRKALFGDKNARPSHPEVYRDPGLNEFQTHRP
jgi:hypothetical protein